MGKSTTKVFDETLVLVLDDNHNLSPNLNSLLLKTGLKPVFVSSGIKGLSILKHAKLNGTPFGLIICDYKLPDMNGLEFAQSVRSDPIISDSQIIALTPDHPISYLYDFSRLRVPHVLQRPCVLQDLTGAVAEYLPLKWADEIIANDIVSPGQAIKILCADDNAINLAVLKGFLSIAGYVPDTVENGEEALKAYNSRQYDLILMDIMMPVMDGTQATQHIRELEKRASRSPVPIIAVTAHYTPSERGLYIKLGMNDVIAKPISKNVIDACLEKWCPHYQSEEKIFDKQDYAASA